MNYLNFKRALSNTAIAGLFSIILFSCGKPNDEEIQENITKKMQEGGIEQVSTSVKDGIVTLAGTCEGEDCATKIQQQVAEVEGVKTVENNIQVNTTTDFTLRTSIQTIITKYPGVQADVAAGEIVLRGSISRDQLQPLMAELQALQPKKIDNQLAVN